MARRTTQITRPSRRERRFWSRLALLLIPLAVWTVSRGLGAPPLPAMFGTGLACGMVLSPLLARAARRVIRWAHTDIPAVTARKEGTAR